MKQWKNRGFRKFSILSFILVVFLLFLKTGEILALEIKIIPFGISKNKGGIEANIISSESKGDIAIPKFNWRFPSLTFLVDNRGRFYPNYYYLKEGTDPNIPYKRNVFHLSTPLHRSGVSFHFANSSVYKIYGDETYYFVDIMRKPFGESGVIFSSIGKIYVNKEKEIETLEIVGKSDLPSKVLQTFKREISKVLLEQGFSRDIAESF